MAKRLNELYRPGDLVEIWLNARWLAGHVTRLQHPGIWVSTVDGGHWFVTNGRRIRHAKPDNER